MTDNLYCPGCSQRSDSVTALIQHLDMCEHDLRYRMKPEILTDKLRKGGKEPEIKMDLLLVRKMENVKFCYDKTVKKNSSFSNTFVSFYFKYCLDGIYKNLNETIVK